MYFCIVRFARPCLMPILDFLRNELQLSEDIIRTVSPHIKHTEFKKKEVILDPDHKTNNIHFIESGIVRSFYRTEAKEITLAFVEENEICITINSIFFDKPSRFGIQAITPTKMATLDYTIWEQIIAAKPELLAINQHFFVKNIKNYIDYIELINCKSPSERYQILIDSNPAIFNKVPLGYIASYLGITQETLSRLRKKV